MDPASDLRTLRKSLGLTIQDLSDLVGVRAASISEAENGLRVPRKNTRARIEHILGNNIDWLRTYSSDREDITYFLREFINPDAPGIGSRVRIARQTLKAIEILNN